MHFSLAFILFIRIFGFVNKSNKQIDTFSQLRLPLIVLITFAPSYSGVRAGWTLWDGGWDSYEMLKLVVSETLVKVAMPTFFVMSGYLFFVNATEWNTKTYWSKLRRRVKTLLIPYIIWNIAMAVKLRTFSLSIFIEPANMPLWFLRDLMIVSLLTPIIYIGVRKLGYWIFAILLPIYLTGLYAVQPGPTPYAICFFTLGAFLSIRKMDLIEICIKYGTPSYILTVLLGIGMILTFRTSIYPLLMLCFRVVGVIAVFCIAHRILSNTNKRIPQIACNASYFIYLAHYVFFFAFLDAGFFSLFCTSTASLCIHYLTLPLLKVGILIGVYVVYRYCIFSKILSLPKRHKAT